MLRYFELNSDASSKFWEITLDDSTIKTRYDKIGADGQTTEKSFDSPEKAQKEYDKLVKEKTGKGYLETINTSRLPADKAGAKPSTQENRKAKAKPTKFSQAGFSALMKKAEQLKNDEAYNPAMVSLAEAENMLVASKNDDIVSWAYVFDFQRYVLHEMGKKDDALAVCRKALERIGASAEWAYLSEYNVVRNTKRACSGMLAYELSDAAETLADVETAIQYIESAFSSKSPIEDADVLDPFLEIRALVYAKAKQFDEKFKLKSYETAAAFIRKKGVEEDALSDELKSVVKDPEFNSFLLDNPFDKLKQGSPGETWQEALTRYTSFFKLYNLELYDIEDLNVVFDKPETPKIIAELEVLIDCKLPEALKNLYLRNGAVMVGHRDGTHIKIFPAAYLVEELKKALDAKKRGYQPTTDDITTMGLEDMIVRYWGGRDELYDNLTADQLGFLNHNYKIIGHRYCSDDEVYFIYFDRNGNMDYLHFHQDDICPTDYLELKHNKTLDEVISFLIDGLIVDICEDEDTYCEDEDA